MPRAFVTGAGGQDGIYMCRSLVADGYEVTGTLRPGGRNPGEAGVHYAAVDMRDAEGLTALVRNLQPDEIYNLAGVSSLAEANADPQGCFDVNAEALEHLVGAAGAATRVCQASSALIFGPPDGEPRNEDTPLNPVGAYAEAKTEAHLLIGRERAAGRHAVSAILFNHESPLRSTRFVTRKVTKGVADIVAGRAERLHVHDLGAKRDWGFAGDYVRAMRSAMSHGSAADFVIATGVLHTVRDFVEKAFACAGIEDWASWVSAETDRNEPSSPGDASKARRELGWEPAVDFDGLVEMMVRHDLETV